MIISDYVYNHQLRNHCVGDAEGHLCVRAGVHRLFPSIFVMGFHNCPLKDLPQIIKITRQALKIARKNPKLK